MNTPLISALLPSAAPQPSAVSGSGAASEGNTFASILSGQQSQYGATQGTGTSSNSQSVSQQNNAQSQSASGAGAAPSNGSGANSTPESASSNAQSSSSTASGAQGAESAQAGGSAEGAQSAAANQETNATTAANASGGQNTTPNQSTPAAEPSESTLTLAAQQAVSALMPGLLGSNGVQAEATPPDDVAIDYLAASTDALSGHARAGLAGHGTGGTQQGDSKGAQADFAASASLAQTSLATGAASVQGRSSLASGNAVSANTATTNATTASAQAAATLRATESATLASGSRALLNTNSVETTLTPLASALGGLSGAGASGNGAASTGTGIISAARVKTALTPAAGAASMKWGDPALSANLPANESTSNFLNLVSSSRQLFASTDAVALEQAGNLRLEDGANASASMGAQVPTTQGTTPGLRGASGLAVSAAVSTPLSNPKWGTEFTRTVFNLSQGNTQGPVVAEMRLDPPDLGPIRITLTLHENTMQAAFVSPHAIVRQTVENALPQLQQLLAQAGIALGDASVNDQGTPGQSEQAAQGSGKGSGASGSGIDDTASPGAIGSVAAAEASRGALDPNALVDTFA